MPTDIERSYVAGFFDGEGCLSFHIVSKNIRNFGERNHCFSPICLLTNNSKEILIYIQSFFGGKIYKKVRKSKNHNIGWQLAFTSRRDVYNFLKEIVPFLKVKKYQAEIMLVYLESRINKVKLQGQHTPISEYEFSMIRDVRNLNSILNTRVRRLDGNASISSNM